MWYRMHQAEMHNQSLRHPAGVVTIFLHLFQFITIITFTTKMPCKWMIIEIAHDEAIKMGYSDFMSKYFAILDNVFNYIDTF